MTDNRETNRPEARPDLFQLVTAYYREHFEREGRGEEFARWSTPSGGDLQEAARYGADPAFLLHVLVCTAGRRVRRYRDDLDVIGRLAPGQKTLLIGALKLLGELGEPWLKEVLGQAEPDRAHRLFTDITVLSHLLSGGTTTTPAWQSGFGRVPTSRQLQHALTACMVCLMEALKHHPKPAAATVTLLEKFELLPKGARGGPTALAFVKARVR